MFRPCFDGIKMNLVDTRVCCKIATANGFRSLSGHARRNCFPTLPSETEKMGKRRVVRAAATNEIALSCAGMTQRRVRARLKAVRRNMCADVFLAHVFLAVFSHVSFSRCTTRT